MSSSNISLFHPIISDDVGPAIQSVLGSGTITQGERVSKFEHQLAEFLQTPHIVTVNSATSGLTIALRMLDLSPDDEILCTPFTCVATNMAVMSTCAQIRWVDVDPKTCHMDWNDLRSQINERTRAILFVHWGGTPHDLDRLDVIRREAQLQLSRELVIIEDCAHAFGATYKQKPIGSHGNICVFSFQAIKHLTTGDGGCIVLPNKDLADRARRLRWYGIDRENRVPLDDTRMEADIPEWGYKFHMNDIAASMGLANLPEIPQQITMRRYLASYYDEELTKIPGVTCIYCPPEAQSAYWIYTIAIVHKAEFITFMYERGIQVSQVHRRNDSHSCFSEFQRNLPGMDQVEETIVCLPIGPWVTPEDAQYIVCSVQEWCNKFMQVRPLHMRDYDQYFGLMTQMTGRMYSYDKYEWAKLYNKIFEQGSIIYVMQHGEDLIATVKLLIEIKFGDSVGHIEDVVVDEPWRRRGIGSKVMQFVIDQARAQGCYKIVLMTKPHNASFYESLGFKQEQGGFVIRFTDEDPEPNHSYLNSSNEYDVSSTSSSMNIHPPHSNVTSSPYQSNVCHNNNNNNNNKNTRSGGLLNHQQPRSFSVHSTPPPPPPPVTQHRSSMTSNRSSSRSRSVTRPSSVVQQSNLTKQSPFARLLSGTGNTGNKPWGKRGDDTTGSGDKH